MTALASPIESTTLDFDPVRRYVYLDVGSERAFVAHEAPSAVARRDCGVVLCPPFGWEELAAHRALRIWAKELADAGYATARLAYPGTGDSSAGPADPGRLPAWIASVRTAAAWLRERDELETVVALGVGFGALVAQLTAARCEDLDGAVLWAPPRRGRELLRQLRAFSRLEASEAFSGLPAPPPLAPGALEAGGFLLSPETTAALEAVDLGAEPCAHELAHGVLLLGRDGQPADEQLRIALQRSGVEVSVGDGPGYATLTSHPQDAELSAEVCARVRAWLDQRSHLTPAHALATVPDRAISGEQSEMRLQIDGGAIVERPISITAGELELAGVLTEPQGGQGSVAAVFVNAGAIHRVGPNRMYVETARRWGQRGVASLRLDVAGVGESDGPDRGYVDTARLHDLALVDQIAGALDDLQQRGVADRFVVIGMCSGAFWSLQLALRDPRVVSVQLLNLAVIEWDEAVGPIRSLRSISLRSFVNLRRADSRARMRVAVRWLVRRLHSRATTRNSHASQPALGVRVETTLERLRTSGTRVLFLFSAREPLERDLSRQGLLDRMRSWPTMTVSHLAVASHTLRPQMAQAQASEILDADLELTLDALASRDADMMVSPDA